MSTIWKRISPAMAVLALAATTQACSPLQTVNHLDASDHYRKSTAAYGSHPRQRLDVYTPLAKTPSEAVVVFFYGGGWREGARENYEFVAASLTADGMVVVIPDYRLYPEVQFPVFVEDGARALAWVQERLAECGLGKHGVFIAGHSAGAHIAALLALNPVYLSDAGAGDLLIRGWSGLSGPYDFLPLGEGYLRQVFPEATRPESQPIRFVSPTAPPTLLIHGRDDTTVEPGNSERLAAALRHEGADVTLRLYDDRAHASVVVALSGRLGFLGDTLDDSRAFFQRRDDRSGPVNGTGAGACLARRAGD